MNPDSMTGKVMIEDRVKNMQTKFGEKTMRPRTNPNQKHKLCWCIKYNIGREIVKETQSNGMNDQAFKTKIQFQVGKISKQATTNHWWEGKD